MGEYGLTIDNLLAVEVVTATGEIVTASAGQNQDLFWALRGGGGNFGVATSFEYQAHPVSTVYGGMVAHPIAEQAKLFGFYRDLTQSAPDELTVYFNLFADPAAPEEKLAAMIACHCGDDPAAAEADLKSLRRFGPPAADLIQPMPYPGDQHPQRRRVPQKERSTTGSPLSSASYPTPRWRSWSMPSGGAASPMSGLGIVPYLGAVSRHRPDRHRLRAPGPRVQPAHRLAMAGPAGNRAKRPRLGQRETRSFLHPYLASRSYVNNLTADDGRMVQSVWGANYQRLATIKRRYDPGNIFRLNHNIDPSAREARPGPPRKHIHAPCRNRP